MNIVIVVSLILFAVVCYVEWKANRDFQRAVDNVYTGTVTTEYTEEYTETVEE